MTAARRCSPAPQRGLPGPSRAARQRSGCHVASKRLRLGCLVVILPSDPDGTAYYRKNCHFTPLAVPAEQNSGSDNPYPEEQASDHAVGAQQDANRRIMQLLITPYIRSGLHPKQNASPSRLRLLGMEHQQAPRDGYKSTQGRKYGFILLRPALSSSQVLDESSIIYPVRNSRKEEVDGAFQVYIPLVRNVIDTRQFLRGERDPSLFRLVSLAVSNSSLSELGRHGPRNGVVGPI